MGKFCKNRKYRNVKNGRRNRIKLDENFEML